MGVAQASRQAGHQEGLSLSHRHHSRPRGPKIHKLIKANQDIEHAFCEGAAQPISIDQLSIDPYPVVVASNSEFTIAAKVEILEEVPVGTKVKLNILREGFIDFPLPCLDLGGTPVGSCEYDGDFLLNAGTDALCGGGYFPDGQECKLPLKPGTYGGGEPITITLPADLPDLIINLLASGTYKITAHAMLADGSEMTCFYVRLEVTG